MLKKFNKKAYRYSTKAKTKGNHTKIINIPTCIRTEPRLQYTKQIKS